MLDKKLLVKAIKAASEAARKEVSLEAAADIFAIKLADAVDDYVRSGDINTVGTSTAQKGKMT